MSFIDAGTDPVPMPTRFPGHGECGGDSEDTLDLRLPEDFVALFAGGASRTAAREEPEPQAPQAPPGAWQAAPDTARYMPSCPPPTGKDLLDDVAGWGPAATPVGRFRLVPVRPARDLPIISRWMNDPAVNAFWDLAGPPDRTEKHLREQLDGDGRSVPCVGTLDGVSMSYWELYRADLDQLARHYPARPHDTGIHLLIGGVGDRGRGQGSVLLRAVADLVLDRRPACRRVVAEPDIRNTPSIAAFLGAGFRFAAEIDLPGKRAALMIRDRTLRDLL